MWARWFSSKFLNLFQHFITLSENKEFFPLKLYGKNRIGWVTGLPTPEFWIPPEFFCPKVQFFLIVIYHWFIWFLFLNLANMFFKMQLKEDPQRDAAPTSGLGIKAAKPMDVGSRLMTSLSIIFKNFFDVYIVLLSSLHCFIFSPFVC